LPAAKVAHANGELAAASWGTDARVASAPGRRAPPAPFSPVSLSRLAQTASARPRLSADRLAHWFGRDRSGVARPTPSLGRRPYQPLGSSVPCNSRGCSDRLPTSRRARHVRACVGPSMSISDSCCPAALVSLVSVSARGANGEHSVEARAGKDSVVIRPMLAQRADKFRPGFG
jgi:hypothetical protein